MYCLYFLLYDAASFAVCCSTITDVGGLVESGGFRLLESMKAVAMAVSGTRKVACVVCTNEVMRKFCTFYPRDALHHCPNVSVRLSVTRQYCV